ncbi:MAG: hypothetical protein O2960_17390 [Verrucomicrobia bacterium]|nr:hypothetical protein [Verrucomicrobiota bacterium]
MPRPIQSNTLFGVAAIAITVFLASVLYLRRNGTPAPQVPSPGVSQNLRQPTSATSSTDRQQDVLNSLHGAIQALRKSGSAQSSRRILSELAASLAAVPHEDASTAIQEILASGIDVQTQIEFEVGEGGRLNGANTLRVFLLDFLGQIDSQAASEIARTVLRKQVAPDEWAVCLRNFARANASPDSREFLLDRLRALLGHQPWRHDPTKGYLEAFDVVVHLGSGQLVPDLTRLLLMTNNQAAAHASYLALDRLAITDPIPVLAALADDPSLMQGREITRASFFARVDVSNPEQRRLVEEYLTNPSLQSEELEAFADSFPNENYRISQNLITVTPPRPGSVIAQRDRETVRVVEEWMRQERFSGIRPHLEIIWKRLREFTKQEAMCLKSSDVIMSLDEPFRYTSGAALCGALTSLRGVRPA